MATTWRGQRDDDNGKARFGRQAKAWLRRRIQAQFFRPDPNDPGRFLTGEGDAAVSWDRWAVGVLLDWYAERWERCVRWQDADEFRGRGFSHGAWVFQPELMQADVTDAVAHVDRMIDAGRCRTLDEWLRADIDGTLEYRGDPGGMSRVPRKVRRRLATAAYYRERRALREREVQCPCGKQFVAGRANAKYCPECRAIRKGGNPMASA